MELERQSESERLNTIYALASHLCGKGDGDSFELRLEASEKWREFEGILEIKMAPEGEKVTLIFKGEGDFKENAGDLDEIFDQAIHDLYAITHGKDKAASAIIPERVRESKRRVLREKYLDEEYVIDAAQNTLEGSVSSIGGLKKSQEFTIETFTSEDLLEILEILLKSIVESNANQLKKE